MKKKILLLAGMLVVCSALLFLAKGLQSSLYNELTGNTDKKTEVSQLDGKTSSDNIISNSSEAADTGKATSGSEEVKAVSSQENTATGGSVKTDGTQGSGSSPASGSTSTGSSGGSGSAGNTGNTVPASSGSVTTVTPAANNTGSGDNSFPGTGTGSSSVSTAEKPNLIIMDMINNRTILYKYVTYGSRTMYDILSEVLNEAIKNKQIKSYSIDKNLYTLNEDGTVSVKSTTRSDGYVSEIDGLVEKKPSSASGWLYYKNDEKLSFGIKDDLTKKFTNEDVVVFKFWRNAFEEK